MGAGNRWAKWTGDISKRATLSRHALSAALGSGALKWRLLAFLAEIAVLSGGIIWVNPPKGGLVAGAFVVVKLATRVWRGTAAASLKDLEYSTRARSFALMEIATLMARSHRLNLGELKGLQQKVLKVVVSYVRDMRGDPNGTRIFANLLTPIEGELEVCSRSDGRPLRGRVPATSLAMTAYTSGEVQFTGDLYAEFPDAPQGKKYCSILAVPILDADATVVGVVTIDSRERHHFDSITDDAIQHIAPLLPTLGWTVGREAGFTSQRRESP